MLGTVMHLRPLTVKVEQIDARMSGTPVAGYVGQKILAMRVSIFERKR